MKKKFTWKKTAGGALILMLAAAQPFTVAAAPGKGLHEAVPIVQKEKENGKQAAEQRKQERQEIKEAVKSAKAESKELHKQKIEEARQLIEEQVAAFEAAGDTESAFEAQTDLAKLNLKDKTNYKKLGHLYSELHGKKGVHVFVNGSHPVFDVPPVIRSGRTLIPLRAVSASLGGVVEWNQAEKKVTITRDDVVMELYINERTAFINGEEILLDVPAGVEKGRTLVPLRFIGEAFQAYVDWDGENVIVVDEEEVQEGTEEQQGEETETGSEEAEEGAGSEEAEAPAGTDTEEGTETVVEEPADSDVVETPETEVEEPADSETDEITGPSSETV